MNRHVLPIVLLSIVAGVAVLFCSGCNRPKPNFTCTDTLGCVDIPPGAPIQLGVLQALSGKVAQLGKEQMRGMELALSQRAQTVMGHPLELQTEDTGCTSEGGANAALRLIADPQTVAILGTTCSSAAATASYAMSNAGLTMISGNNSAPFLTSIAGEKAPDWHAGYFRTAPNEETAGQAAALFAFQELGIRKAAVINDGDIYTTGLTDGFQKKFQDIGGQVVLDTSVNKGEDVMQPVLEAVLASGAELMFFPLFQPEGNHLLLQAKATPGMEKIRLMSDGALIESSFIEAMQDKAIGMYFVGPSRPTTPESEVLAKVYLTAYQEEPSALYYLSAYDAANLLLAALERIAVLETDGTLHIGRQALRNALYTTRNFHGVTGILDCNRFGDCATPQFNILRLDDPDAGVDGLQANVVFAYTPQP